MGHARIGRGDGNRRRGSDGQGGHGERRAGSSDRNGHTGRYRGGSRVTAGEGDEGATSESLPTQRDGARGGRPAIDAGWIQRDRGEGWPGRRLRRDGE